MTSDRTGPLAGDPDLPNYAGAAPDPAAPRERLAIVVRVVEDGRYLVVRREGARALSLLATDQPFRGEGVPAAVSSIVRTHLGMTTRGEVRTADNRHPVHRLHPYTGGQATGYLRAVAVEAAGEPKSDALYAGAEALPLADAVAALPTDLDRALLLDGARLLGDAPQD